MLDRAKALFHREPARVIALLTALVMAVAAKTGVVLDAAGVAETIALIAPVILGGELIRAKVTPTDAVVIGSPMPEAELSAAE